MKHNQFAAIIRNLGQENRLDIFCFVLTNTGACVSTIADGLGLSVATTSHHLKQLEKIDLLVSKKKGKEVCYSMSKNTVTVDIKKLLCKYITL